jgi:predicted  nucleic acid-binding Zn-ribbon protein
LLREILEHVDSETAKLQESIADASRSKARRQRDLDHAEAEICVELKTIRRHNNNTIPDVPQRTLAKLWQQHRCQ